MGLRSLHYQELTSVSCQEPRPPGIVPHVNAYIGAAHVIRGRHTIPYQPGALAKMQGETDCLQLGSKGSTEEFLPLGKEVNFHYFPF